MYDKKGFRPRTPEDIRTALNDFAAGFAAGLSTFADAVNSIRLPTLQNVTFTWVYDEPTEEEKRKNRHISCEGCKHDLGGGCCRINLETECREGGGFEAWAPRIAPVPFPEGIPESEEDPEPEEVPEFEDKPDLAETILKWASIGICILAYPLLIYKLYEWIKYLFF